MNKENIATTPTFTRKRAKSFSTPPTTKPASKLARGILKGANGDDAHTIAFIPIHSPSKKKTESAEKRRKSLSRRVSFASHASVRLFEKPGESPEAPQTTPRRSARNSPAKSPIRQKNAGILPDSPSARNNSTNDSNDEITMDLAELLPPTLNLQKQSNPLTRSNQPADDEDEDDSSEDDSNAYADANNGEDDTAAMDLTDILPAPTNAAKMSHISRIPRPSMSPRKRNTADLEDESMDMTTMVGQLNPTSPREIERDADMDMTRIVGGIIRQAQSATTSPVRQTQSLLPKPVSQILQSPSKDDADETVNMDETRVFSRSLASPSMRDMNEEPTSHTSYTVATEEDDTQRLCEGSVTQADGFTQNMDLTRVMPGRIQSAKTIPQTVGFAWGASGINPEDVDVSMADVTQNDETTMNMDMTQAVLGPLFEQSITTDRNHEEDESMQMDMTRVLPNNIENDADQTIEMDLTRVVPKEQLFHDETSASPVKLPSVSARPITPRQSPRKNLLSGQLQDSSKQQTPKQNRRLSSGAVRTPIPDNEPNLTTSSSSNAASPVRKAITPRRKSLLENEIPAFGTPEAKVILAPNSSKRAEFGANLIGEDSLRINSLKDRIQSLTPKKLPPANTVTATPTKLQASIESASAAKSASKSKTPLKTPQRSSLLSQNSISRTHTASTPSTKITQAAPTTPLSPIALNEFLKMTGISFLTGLSTTRRRETIALPAALSAASEEEGKVQATDLYTLPMLEMYQHSCRELTKYITEGRAMCDEIEADMNEQNPEIFEQYRRASPAEKRELEASFKQLKTVARLSAKGVWYVWRENLLSGVLVPLRKNLADLEKENARLKIEDEQTLQVYEQAKKEYEELKVKVEQLLREEEEYESFDHEEAARLTKQIAEDEAAIAEQEAQLSQTDLEIAQLLAEKEALDAELKAREEEVRAMEAEAERCRGYSRSEIADLKEQYEAFTQKTGYRLKRVDDREVKLSLKDTLTVVLTIATREISISLEAGSESPRQTIMQYYTVQIEQSLKELTSESLSYRERLSFIREQWSLVFALVTEVEALEMAHPIDVTVNEDDNILIAAQVFLPASKSKFVVKFTGTPLMTADECSLDVVVDVKYGGLDGGKIQQHISSRLHARQNKVAHGWLLESLKMPEGL